MHTELNGELVIQIMKFLGHKLKELRKAKGMTMVDLEAKSNITQSAISQYENNKKEPTHDTASKLSNALGVDLYFFYMEEAIALNPKTIPGLPSSTETFLRDSKSVPYIVLGEKAKESGIPPDFLFDIIKAWEKNNPNTKKQG